MEVQDGDAPDPSRIPHHASRLVIFIDEIDSVRSLPFSTDEFFAAIRECYNRAQRGSGVQRLTFCLLGVATPSDLIQDTRTTPFNIGRRIELTDFTEAEAAPLAMGLLNHGDTETRREAEGDRWRTQQELVKNPSPGPSPRERGVTRPSVDVGAMSGESCGHSHPSPPGGGAGGGVLRTHRRSCSASSTGRAATLISPSASARPSPSRYPPQPPTPNPQPLKTSIGSARSCSSPAGRGSGMTTCSSCASGC